MFEPNEDYQITGTWRSDPDDLEAIRMYGDVSLDFFPDGQLTYTVHSEGKRQIMLLTYRIEGDMLTTDQPSEPKEETTQFLFHVLRQARSAVWEPAIHIHPGCLESSLIAVAHFPANRCHTSILGVPLEEGLAQYTPRATGRPPRLRL